MTLLNIAYEIKDNPEVKNKIKFVFLSDEIYGPKILKKSWKEKNFSLEGRKVINIKNLNDGEIKAIFYSDQKNDIVDKSYNYLKKNYKKIEIMEYDLAHKYFSEYDAISLVSLKQGFLKLPVLEKKEKIDIEGINIFSETFLKMVE
jgi:acylphosphatase